MAYYHLLWSGSNHLFLLQIFCYKDSNLHNNLGKIGKGALPHSFRILRKVLNWFQNLRITFLNFFLE